MCKYAVTSSATRPTTSMNNLTARSMQPVVRFSSGFKQRRSVIDTATVNCASVRMRRWILAAILFTVVNETVTPYSPATRFLTLRSHLDVPRASTPCDAQGLQVDAYLRRRDNTVAGPFGLGLSDLRGVRPGIKNTRRGCTCFDAWIEDRFRMIRPGRIMALGDCENLLSLDRGCLGSKEQTGRGVGVGTW
ncbi:hypothetical protein EK21DRAFT_84334 [Setomelanomma holmii]|uniref:Uncharacterized protein n=1 Tax=Setomelanomma holmii TaxID=210430 RepID=A0A9P4HIT8_9PLEO|nr:hypothetical protein EK21DRAFT_84334 [Setomelanomma holmii]